MIARHLRGRKPRCGETFGSGVFSPVTPRSASASSAALAAGELEHSPVYLRDSRHMFPERHGRPDYAILGSSLAVGEAACSTAVNAFVDEACFTIHGSV